jgi:lysozyme family protein
MTINDILCVSNISACPARFRQALSILLPLECEFEHDGVTIRTENVQGDSGGRTFAGLDEATWAPLGFPYDDPTPKAVVAAYEQEWNALRACELPHPVGSVLFIQGTNQGDHRSVAMLQAAINDFNPASGKISEDGIMGAATVRAGWGIDSRDLARSFLSKSRARYKQLVAQHPALLKFADGWMSRVVAIEKFYELGFDSSTLA